MEPNNLNALVKEYVNLSFHGMRASKNPINVDIDLKLDDKVGDIPLIAEDFSRVIVNLCNNAFDAMREKAKVKSEKGEEFLPVLSVKTSRNGKSVEVQIADNGPGIPVDLKDKVLQPFFTTKKGTEGTGLGLSITNDIIKAHGGVMTIESDTKGSTFKIHLPR
jgi:signal transduction histidine kinase